MSPLTRRKLLLSAPLAASAATLAGCKLPARKDPFSIALKKPPVPGSAGKLNGQEELVNSVCGQCPAGCGITVRLVEGRAVKIDGNPLSPVNEGSVGPKGQAGVELLYHPDRIKGPLKRDGERGSGKWKAATWDEALAAVGGALKELREKGQPQGLVVMDGVPRGPMHELWGRFAAAFGSPNHVDHRAVTDGGKVLATYYMHGVGDLPAYDWSRTRYVLGLSTSLFESWCQSIHVMRTASDLRHSMPGKRVKFVQVSARFSPTSMKADEWVPISPGTYGALALGLAHVLVRDGKYDQAFVKEHCFGFEDFQDAAGQSHRGFKGLVAKDYPPEKVEQLTGVPKEAIERLAKEMVEFGPAVVIADGGAASATNGLGTAMAIHALNALLGNLERPGGLVVQRKAPLADWKPVEPDEVAKAGAAAPRLDGAGSEAAPLALSRVHALPPSLGGGGPYPAQALLLFQSNPFFSKPGGGWAEAVKKVPLVVSFSPLPDESTLWADWVLPDHTYLERFDLVEPAPGLARPVIALRQPAVPPQHDTRHTGDVLLALAKAVGGSVAAAFPWNTYRDALVERLAGLTKAPGGSAEGDDAEALLEGMGESSSWFAKELKYEDWAGAFPTPSGKFELYSQRIAERLAKAFPTPEALAKALESRGVQSRGDALCLPHWEPPRFVGDEKEFPLVVLPYRAMNYAEGGVRHQKRLRALPLVPGLNPGKPRVELNPIDADALGLKSGELVRVETPAGSQVLTLLVSSATRPGAAGLPLGLGQWPPRPGDPPQGGYALLAPESDPLAGIFASQGTRARIRRAS